ncbi:zinc finger protein 845-like isoform X2 [Lineus longissimus]|uniref:zinc finger protein 845-like isoform X2 n=1 Tax=Lineus longissimus TaxID=88925 RepID=UPI002B4ECE1A
MMKDYSTMSLAETQEEKGQPLHDMKMELHSKGAVLTNAWSDLSSFLTKYQAELTRKEFAVEIAGKEVDIRKKQLEEMKLVLEFGNDEVSNLQNEVQTKESQINHLQSELLIKEQLVQKMQLDLDCNQDLVAQSRNDFHAEYSELVQCRGNLEKLQSELSVKQEQIEIKDILLKKMQGQLMSENADLKEQLEKERSAHELTKKRLEEKSKSTAPLLKQFDLSISNIRTEPQQRDHENNSSAKSCKLKSLLTGKTAFTVTALGTAPGTSVICTTDVPQKKTRYSTRSTSSGLNQESDSVNIPTQATSGSEVYFPLSVSGEAGQESVIDTVSEMFTNHRDLKNEHFDKQPGKSSSGSDTDIMDALEYPVPVSGPIPHYMGYAANSEKAGEKEKTIFPGNRKKLSKSKNKADNDVMCDLCGKIVSNHRYLIDHKAQVHGIGKCLICEVCGKSLCKPSQYRDHVNAHKGIKEHQCPDCKKSFCFQTSLNRHIQDKICKRPLRNGKKSNAPKIFACEQCHQAYSTKTSLSQHINGMHGRRMYHCLVCRKDFRWRSGFNKHKKKHLTSST